MTCGFHLSQFLYLLLLYFLCEKTSDIVLEGRQGTAVQQLMETLKPFILSGKGLNLLPGFLKSEALIYG